MLGLRHLNMDKAVNNFLENVEKLSRLPLITDDEMLELWGQEVTESIAVLANYSRRKKICASCPDRCCLLVHCELYHSGFSECPILPYRPAICRMHFCDRFEVGDISFIREFADIYLNSLFEATLQGSRKVDLFDSPPLHKYAPELLAAVSPLINACKEGSLDQASTLSLIQTEAEKFRSSPAALVPQKADQSLKDLFEERRTGLVIVEEY